jgi:rod shape determining protein RodA
LQPDLGSASILFGIWFGFLSISGLPRRYFVIAAVFAIIGGALLWQFGLKPYQKDRIVGVFYPEKNALTVNYSVIQSRIAIGSAGFWGKGYHQGTQTQLGFLSEPANDFALSAFIEEWGWSSGLLIISALLLLEFSVLRIGMRARRNVEKFICIGTAMMWIMQFFINAGSATGLFPVVGVTFPFLSYGGSSLLANFLLFGLIFSIYKHQ